MRGQETARLDWSRPLEWVIRPHEGSGGREELRDVGRQERHPSP